MPYASGLAGAVQDIIDRRGQAIVLERGASTVLASQTVVIDRYVSGADIAALGVEGGQSGRSVVRINGDADLNIKRGDRFVLGSLTYDVIMAHPADDVQRVAYAEGRES